MKKAISATLVFTLSSSIGAFTNNAIIRRRHNNIIINDHKKSSSLNLIINSDLNNNNNNNDEVSQRRAFIRNITGAAFGTTMGLLVNQEPASATYSAYANREKDWQQRQEKGEVKISTARDLKRQLAEVAPMNVAKSQVFCPNGPSAAVSPLMENKCNDQLAMPSVFGRSDDILGNSIPGKNAAYLGSADTGGFPSYK